MLRLQISNEKRNYHKTRFLELAPMKTLQTIHFALIFLWLCFTAGKVSGQSGSFDSVRTKFDSYRNECLQEKIYLHLDRTLFLTGEILWFKAYAVDGTLHKPLSLSKVVYVEVLDKSNTAILQAKIAMHAGTGQGSLFLPATLGSGVYQVRAYTTWMKNYSADFFFHQAITIVNTFVKPEGVKTTPNSQNLVFFPEGGNLVNGISSKVGFKFTDASAKPAQCKGAVINHQNDTIARFRTLVNGIGQFYFKPKAGETYRAAIITNGHTAFHPFPTPYPYGWVMHVSDSADFLKVIINSTENSDSDPLLLFIHSRQIVTHAIAKKLNNHTGFILIEKKQLSDGISHITLFDANQHPLCERLYFKYPATKLGIEIKSDRSSFEKRSKVRLDVSTHINGIGAPANLSLSVHKVDSIPAPAQLGIFNYLWLSSDLVGTVDSLNYYFGADNRAVEAMDNLMITQGWRRFRWEDILRRHIDIPYVPEYRGQVIHGNVIRSDGKTASGVNVYLSTPDKVVRLYTSTSDYHGNVQLEAKDIYGARTLVIRAGNSPDSVYAVTLDDPFSSLQTTMDLPQFDLSSAFSEQLRKRSFAMQVQDVYHEDKRDRFLSDPSDTVSFYGKADKTYFLDDYTRFPLLEEILREYVPGVNVRKRNGKFDFIVLDEPRNKFFANDPLILMDGVPLVNADDIMSFDPRKMKKLEVMNHKYYQGTRTVEGIISYSTYQGDLAGMTLNPKLITIDYEGLQLQREFYMPDYSDPKQHASRIPDQRNLLYWNPEVTTDKEGKCTLEFYTSDLKGNFKVRVEGLSDKGMAGTTEFSFIVK
jgi:hypothetical protein